MQKTKYFLFIKIFFGALLIAGLFYFFTEKNISQTNERAVLKAKPSLFNFSESNHIQGSQSEANLPNDSTITSKNDSDIVFKPQLTTATDQQRWQIFENILSTKNDNDSHLDRDLKNLSPEFRKALTQKYETIPLEKRSERGLIVYLIGRDIKSAEDYQFLKKIFEESPCMSLSDCKNPPAQEDAHHSDINQTTLDYPQKAALYLLDKRFTESPLLLQNPQQRDWANQILRQAELFPVPSIQQRSRDLRAKFGL